jgi:hypothetical protein
VFYGQLRHSVPRRITPDERMYTRFYALLFGGVLMFAVGIAGMRSISVEAGGMAWFVRLLAFFLSIGGMLVGGTGLGGLIVNRRR